MAKSEASGSTTTGAALAFAKRGKPEVLHWPLNLDINSSIPRNKQVTEMDAGRFSNNYSKQKQTISYNPAVYAFVIHNALKIFEKCLVAEFFIHSIKREK